MVKNHAAAKIGVEHLRRQKNIKVKVLGKIIIRDKIYYCAGGSRVAATCSN
jgi:hypothetical protein